MPTCLQRGDEGAPKIELEIEKISKTHDDLQTTVPFLSNKYDDQLTSFIILYHQSNIIESLRKDLDESRKIANEAHMQTEELAQYIRRDCLEISGIAPNEELSCEGVVRSVGNAIDVSVSDMDISVSHPIPSFNTTAPSKIIVKLTRREICDRFYYNRKNSRSVRGNRSRTSLVLH